MEATAESLVDESHADRLRQSLVLLCNKKSLCDVVLRSVDGCDLQAHWLVLASTSDFFAAQSYSPIFYTDLEISVLSVIVNYIYTGRISITQEKRDKLLLGCKKLKLTELESLILNTGETSPSKPCDRDSPQNYTLLYSWRKHPSPGTGISSGLSTAASAGPAGNDYPERNVGIAATGLTASNTEGRHVSARLSGQLAWDWDPALRSSKGQTRTQNETSLLENVEFQVKQEVLSDIEQEVEGDFSLDNSDSESDYVKDTGEGRKERKKAKNGVMRVTAGQGQPRVVLETETVGKDSEAGNGKDMNDIEMDEPQVTFWQEAIESAQLYEIQRNSNQANLSESGLFMCELCGQSCPSKHDLCLHREQIHKRNTNHQCPFCPDSFTEMFLLQRHLDDHGKKKMHKCACGKSFSHPNALGRHAALCTGKTSVACSICLQTFSRRDSLTRHMKGVHQHMNAYKCACNKRFRWSSGLSKHRKSCQFVKSDQVEQLNLIQEQPFINETV